MVKHNNIASNNHFRKDWQRFVKVRLNQPARKQKALNGYVKLLRPVVRGQTLKYNRKVKLGRGFTDDELKGAGLSHVAAKRMRIAHDRRRVNRSEETFAENVQRLKAYIEKVTRQDAKGKNRLDHAVMVDGACNIAVSQAGPLKGKVQEVELTTDMISFDAHEALRKQWFLGRKKPKKEDPKKKNKKKKKK